MSKPSSDITHEKAAAPTAPAVARTGAERLDDARARASARPTPAMGRHNTFFGTVTLTDRNRGLGGFATTNNQDHPGSTTTDGSYKQLVGRATPETLQAVEAASRQISRPAAAAPAAILDPTQRRVASQLLGISLSETQRDPVGGKAFRGGIRAANARTLAGGNAADSLAAFEQASPMAAPAKDAPSRGYASGAQALLPYQGRAGVKQHRSELSRMNAGAALSDSSDDEQH